MPRMAKALTRIIGEQWYSICLRYYENGIAIATKQGEIIAVHMKTS